MKSVASTSFSISFSFSFSFCYVHVKLQSDASSTEAGARPASPPPAQLPLASLRPTVIRRKGSDVPESKAKGKGKGKARNPKDQIMNADLSDRLLG